jgi:hypothetical protein
LGKNKPDLIIFRDNSSDYSFADQVSARIELKIRIGLK